MAPFALLHELSKETDVPLKEQLYIINSVFQHCDTFHTHAEGEAGSLARVVAVALHELENVGIDHAAPQQLDPATHLAKPASLAAAFEAGHLHVSAGFGEGEERRVKPCLHAR